METVEEAIDRHKSEIARLQKQKERSGQRDIDYLTKCSLKMLERLDDLSVRLARIEDEALSASVGR